MLIHCGQDEIIMKNKKKEEEKGLTGKPARN